MSEARKTMTAKPSAKGIDLHNAVEHTAAHLAAARPGTPDHDAYDALHRAAQSAAEGRHADAREFVNDARMITELGVVSNHEHVGNVASRIESAGYHATGFAGRSVGNRAAKAQSYHAAHAEDHPVHAHLAKAYGIMGGHRNTPDKGQAAAAPHLEAAAQAAGNDKELQAHVQRARTFHQTQQMSKAEADTGNRFQGLAEASLLAFARR